MGDDADKDHDERRLSGPPLWGRRVAQAGYYLFVIAVLTTATVQITQQVFFPVTPESPPPFSSCETGILALHEAIERGRQAADPRHAAEPDHDPEQALQRYRAAVRPVWAHRETVHDLCGRRHARLLDALRRLRYSEEHGVRHQAVELTALRRRVRGLVAGSLDESPTRSNQPDRP